MNGIVKFIIDCVKRGSGVTDVTKDVKEAQREAGAFAKGLMALGGTANVVGRLLRGVVTGGMWEVGAIGIKFLIGKFEELKKRAVESAEYFGKALARAAEASEKRFKQVADAISSAIARAKDLMKLSEARGKLHVTAETERINAKARNALAGTADESERAVIKANAQLKIARLQEAEQSKRSAADVRLADRQVDLAGERLGAAEKELEKAKKRERDADVRLSVALKSENDDRIKVANENHVKAVQERIKAEERVAAEEEKVAAAEIALKTARVTAEESRIKASEAVSEAEFQLADAERKEAKAKEEKAEADRKKAAEKSEEERKKQLEQFEREAAEAEKAFMAQQRDQLLDQLDADTEQKKKRLYSQLLPQLKSLDAKIGDIKLRLKKAEAGIALGEKGAAAFASGQVGFGDVTPSNDPFHNWRRNQYAGRRSPETQDEERAAKAEARGQAKYDRLMEESRGKRRMNRLSDQDKRFMEQWEQFQEQKDNAAKARGELENAQQKRDTLQNEMKSLLQSIDQNIKTAIGVA